LEFTRVRAGQFLDIWSRLQRERIMYIGQDLDDEYANQVFVDPLVCVCIWITYCNSRRAVRILCAVRVTGLARFGRWWPCC